VYYIGGVGDKIVRICKVYNSGRIVVVSKLLSNFNKVYVKITYDGGMIRFRKYSVSCWKGYGRIDIFLKKYRNKFVEVIIYLNEKDALKDSDVRRYILRKILQNFIRVQRGSIVIFDFKKICAYARRKFHLNIEKWYREFRDIVENYQKIFRVDRFWYGGQLRRSKYYVRVRRKPIQYN